MSEQTVSPATRRSHESSCPLDLLTPGIPFVAVTPDMPTQPRREEVLAWLKGHPEVDRYAVIDDEDDDLDDLPLFQPSARTGLTPEIAAGVADYLDRKTN